MVGLGTTGLSCARFLAGRGREFVVVDSRAEPPGLAALREELPEVEFIPGAFDPALFASAAEIILSPGVALTEPAVQAAREAGVPLLGDIEIFAKHAEAPILAVTGSNGKSTVATLLAEMGREAGLRVKAGGNLGPAALDLLRGEVPDLYVLELSSFQLELAGSLDALAAVVLNVSDDHLDRHHSLDEYAAIKARIYRGNGTVVLNMDDPMVSAMAKPGRKIAKFSLAEPASETDYGILVVDGQPVLARGSQALLPTGQMRLAGRHNWANALAALALGEAAGFSCEAMLRAIRDFPGLSHRCQWVAGRDGVNWYNDSKGTNVGATIAALEGMPGEKVVLIAGGEGKGADFSPLRGAVAKRARAVVLIGRDANIIESALAGTVPLLHAADMHEAVALAKGAAQAGDTVLLSPACASFDMFSNYRERGDRFVEAVEEALE